jgi:hypothetical protein
MLFAFVLFIGSIVALFRIGLILIGAFKGPILNSFEKYGEEEHIYFPLPSMLFWSGTFVVSSAILLSDAIGVSLQFTIIALLIYFSAYWAWANPGIARQYPQIFMIFPRWYYDLRDRTSREERRRLAYMWLWLPRRLRLIYNGSDRAFNQWADLVIMSSMRFDEQGESWHEDKYFPDTSF